MKVAEMKIKLFEVAAHRRLRRLSNKEPFVFHGFDLTDINLQHNQESSFLDVGCGFGIDMAQATLMGFGETIGVDVNLYDDWLIAKSYFPSMKHILLEDKRLPFANKTFNFVNSYHVLEHVEDDNFLIQEIHRVLKDDGWAVISVPDVNNLQTMAKYQLKFDKPYLDPTHIREYTLSEIKNKINKYEFEIVSINKDGFVFPVPFINRIYHFFSTCYFDLNNLNNFLGRVIPYSSLGYNLLIKKISKP
ncbi:MAG: class I SAM-dependent methyltransferase [Goleter apudmare HA4340-LM2]|jgi:SAM-dependent methyltransferase|nr:class I SAM-dependent methyltransferase [Goleter apudmare HA4340-LM2]